MGGDGHLGPQVVTKERRRAVMVISVVTKEERGEGVQKGGGGWCHRLLSQFS